MIFKATFDKTVRIITHCVACLFLGLIFIPYLVGGEKTASIYVGVVVALIFLIAFGFHTNSYKITDEEVIVNRPFYPAHFKKNKLKNAQVIDVSQISGSIRTFGNGGIFGYTGYFANFKIGNMVWYVTRKDKLVLMTMLNDTKIILSPDEPQKFVEGFNSHFLSLTS